MIVSMATKEYLGYLHIMLTSLFFHNPDYSATVYLINCNDRVRDIFSQQFPNAMFLHFSGDFGLKPNNNPSNEKVKVTWLKGKFMNMVSNDNAEDVIWIDATALIRGKLDEIYHALRQKPAALVKRPSNKPRFNYAAEIFGIRHDAKIQLAEYEASCKELQHEWYADQKSLNIFSDIYKLAFGRYCNFYFGGQALTWSDRGRQGKGNFTVEDNEYTLKQFTNELTRMIPNYNGKYLEFMRGISNADDRIKILAFLDDEHWCYTTTVYNIENHLRDEFKITIIHNATNEKSKVLGWEGDFVWCRCDARRAKKLFSVRPDLQKKSFSSITIGGELLHERISNNKSLISQMAGLICQNLEAKWLLQWQGFNNVHLLPNGVDTAKFHPAAGPERFTVGFAGRNKRPSDDEWKGYSRYVKPICEALKIPLEVADNLSNQYAHEEMQDFYQKISVLLLPSKAEGCSNTILEAQAAGIPVITTRTGWHFENCVNYEDIVFCSRNLIDIESKVKSLMNEKYREQISHKARNFAENHSWAAAAVHYRNEFKKMKKEAQ